MVNDNDKIKMTNRSQWRIGYKIPDMGNLVREFMPGESKMIPAEEIRKLNWTPGGNVLLQDDLVLDNAELVEELLGVVEPEYNYDKEKVIEILLNGSMDEFMDTLDFAPDGIIDMMKDLAIELEIPDVRKRDALTKKTGVNITNAIQINHISNEGKEEDTQTVKQRRVSVSKEDTKQPERRVPTQNQSRYNIVSKKN